MHHLDESHRPYDERKDPVSKGYTYYMIPLTQHSPKGKIIVMEPDNWPLELGVGEDVAIKT